MRALVTGSAGFVGRHLCPKLEAAGYQVGQVDPQRTRPDGTQYSWASHAGVEEFVEVVPNQTYDLVVHLAANIVNVDARMKGGIRMYDDIELDLAMCRWLEKNPPKQCAVLMSSCAIDYPEDPYCIVKRNLESFAEMLHEEGVPVIVLRPFSGYGEDQSEEYPFRAILERALRKENPLTVWGGSQVRDWIHIEDLTDAILFAAEHAPKNSIPIEVGTTEGTSLHCLAERIAEAVGYDPDIYSDKNKRRSSPMRIAGRTIYPTLQKYGWSPKISLAEGIRRAVAAKLVTA
jgi:nucleoside-diphosphate-sugar epimerase